MRSGKSLRYPIFMCLMLVASLGSGCVRVQIRVLEPAAITFPPDVKTLAVIDRSVPSGVGQGVLGAIEGALSGEAIGADRVGRAETMNGVMRVMNESPRFKAVVPMGDPRATQPDLFGREMSWQAAKTLCAQVQCQGIVALEIFDTDSRVVESRKVVEETNDKGQTVKKTVFEATRETRVTVGWRVYDTLRMTVIDQMLDQVGTRTWTGDGESPAEALAELPSQYDSIAAVAADLGVDYGRRVTPYFIYVSRKIYTKYDDRLKGAHARVTVNDWDGASQIWLGMLQDPNMKARGKAKFNLALAGEVAGDLDGALKNAQDAYAYLDNRRSRKYVETLQYRIAQRERLEQQMKVAPTPPPPPPPSGRTPPPPRGRR